MLSSLGNSPQLVVTISSDPQDLEAKILLLQTAYQAKLLVRETNFILLLSRQHQIAFFKYVSLQFEY